MQYPVIAQSTPCTIIWQKNTQAKKMLTQTGFDIYIYIYIYIYTFLYIFKYIV